MARREVRLSFSRFDWLKEIWCWIVKHDEYCVPVAATDDYAGTYCLRCGAHWNHAENPSPAERSGEGTGSGALDCPAA